MEDALEMEEEEEVKEVDVKKHNSNNNEDPDCGESNYFSEPKFDSVIDRYYTKHYKHITPTLIS